MAARSGLGAKLVWVCLWRLAEWTGRPEMAEAHQARVQAAVEEMVQSLEKNHIRKMQVGVINCGNLACACRTSSPLSALCITPYSCVCVSCCRVACSGVAQTAVINPQTPCLRCISVSRGVTLLWPKLRDWSPQSWRSFRWETSECFIFKWERFL